MKVVRVVVAALLAASAVVFAIGVSVERSQSTHHDETAPSAGAGATPQGAEGSAAREAAEKKPRVATDQAASATETGGESTEKVFGINTESVGLVVAVVIASLLLAAIALAVRSPLVLGIIIVVALAAAVFDAREIAHQLDESRNGVATLAALTMTLHLLAALVAVAGLVVERREASAAERT
jgi:hypothetical protein